MSKHNHTFTALQPYKTPFPSKKSDLVMAEDKNGDNGEGEDKHQGDAEKNDKHLPKDLSVFIKC